MKRKVCFGSQLQAVQCLVFGPVAVAAVVRQVTAGGMWWGRLVNRKGGRGRAEVPKVTFLKMLFVCIKHTLQQ